MMKLKEEYLCNALDRFKEMVMNGICSKQDILHYADVFKYELDRYGASIKSKIMVTKKEACKILGISKSTFDRKVLRGIYPRGKKVKGQNNLLWNSEQLSN